MIIVYMLCIATYSSFADESLSDFAKRLNTITAPAQQMINSREACARGNDNACYEIGIDTGDPCRAYITTSTEQYACRLQQCRNGNQIECNKIQEYNNRMRTEELKREQCESNPHSVWNGSFCQNNMR